jgi:endonuclease/exonuclease/phosphatase family metal-dependent hydrolase
MKTHSQKPFRRAARRAMALAEYFPRPRTMSSTRRRIVPVLRLDLIFISNQAARSKRFFPAG